MTPVKIMLVGADSGLAALVKDARQVLPWSDILMEGDAARAAGAADFAAAPERQW